MRIEGWPIGVTVVIGLKSPDEPAGLVGNGVDGVDQPFTPIEAVLDSPIDR